MFSESKIKSSQVAALLENHIAKGKLSPGERLKSTRALADDFGVGQRVIISALDILEWKRLVKRKERYGVYVCHPSRKPDIKEVMILAFGGTPSDNSFVRRVSEFMHFPTVKEKYDFFVRFIPGKDAHMRFDTELERMEKFGYPDCVLVVGLGFCRREIEKALTLSYPVLFLGNFMEGDYPDLKYNRIGGDNYSPLKVCLEYALSKKLKKLMLISDQDYFEHNNFRKARENAEFFAHEHGLVLDYHSIPGEKEDMPKVFAEYLAKIKKAGTLPELLIMVGADPFDFQKNIEAEDIKYQDDLDIISISEPANESPYIKYVDRDYNIFYTEMVKAIDKICSKEDADYGIKDIKASKGINGE